MSINKMKKENTEVLTLDHGSPLFTVIGRWLTNVAVPIKNSS